MKNKSLFLISILLSLAILSPPVFFFGKIYFSPQTLPKTFLVTRDFSNLTVRQASEKFDSEFRLPSSLILSHLQAETELRLSSISASINKKETLEQLFPQRFQPLSSFFKDKNHLLKIKFDQSLLDTFISTFSAQIEKPFIPTEISLNSYSKLESKKGSLGYQLNEDGLKSNVIHYLSYFKPDAHIPVPVEKIGYLPTDLQVEDTLKKAQNLIGKSLILNNTDYYIDDIIIDDKTLISWLEFNGSLKTELLTLYIDGVNQSIKKDPVNAIFRFEEQVVKEFKPAKNGFFIDQGKLLQLIEENFSKISKENDKDPVKIFIPLQIIEPIVRTQDVNNLGIKELLGRGTSTFNHSSQIRNMNIEKGSSVISGILVPSGETFSFVESLGEVTLATGYQKAYIIREGRTELDVGGGICQVSTTLFRAMLDAGMDIIERQPHAFRVSYYEEDSLPGYDATVFIPKPDLRFINDTANHVLIQSTYDGINKKLIYEIYGTSDGRQVEIGNYKKWGHSAPPPTKYIDDSTLPPGELVREEYAVAGLKTAFDWKVTRGDQVIHQKTFSSSYVPWPAVFRRGI
ncbi:VanW family protein [Patescibacteria group bacterium]|nr:VanW family protein [Patescibacteria group bacterium]MCG2702607.1 VanW family protein [Candidatus Parcubacteria bacterium]MBU4265499.1 VanW family protein [Patescibacteria group bacterium]MBU4390549.1 VanW family protein [Patescibacteria group bacterium]MBU4397219.1 VanW family protein [Patescibacteria group bacterium]